VRYVKAEEEAYVEILNEQAERLGVDKITLLEYLDYLITNGYIYHDEEEKLKIKFPTCSYEKEERTSRSD